VADDLADHQGETEEPAYRPRPPLWQPKPEPPPSIGTLLALGVLTLALLGLVAVWLEGPLLKMPVGQTTVTVVRIRGGTPTDELPASYRYAVELPDGSTQTVALGRLHRPGERLLLTASRGMLTGRIRLGAPYVVIADPPAELPTGDPGVR
jgi:hypothetical protein